MQVSQILAEIKRSLKEPADTDGHWTTADLMRRINLVQGDIARTTLCMQLTAPLSFDTFEGRFAKPVNCLKIKSMTYNSVKLIETTETALDTMASEGRIASDWRNVYADAPRYYIQDYEYIIFFPIPNDTQAIDIENPMYVAPVATYNYFPEDLQTPDQQPFDEVDFLQSASQTIIDGVVYRCMLEDQNPLFTEYKEQYNLGIAKLTNQLTNNNTIEAFGR